jgi:Protein of unknown function (DUF3489)
MTKIEKTTEREVIANSSVTKPTPARQTGNEPNSTKVTLRSRKSAVSKVVALPAEKHDVITPQPEVSQADTAPEIAAAKPKTTKQEQVLTLLSQAGGVTINEVMKATGWQQHSVRGFFAGTVRKKLGFELTSAKEDGGERRYAIKIAA